MQGHSTRQGRHEQRIGCDSADTRHCAHQSQYLCMWNASTATAVLVERPSCSTSTVLCFLRLFCGTVCSTVVRSSSNKVDNLFYLSRVQQPVATEQARDRKATYRWCSSIAYTLPAYVPLRLTFIIRTSHVRLELLEGEGAVPFVRVPAPLPALHVPAGIYVFPASHPRRRFRLFCPFCPIPK